jgi:hypothetical protein
MVLHLEERHAVLVHVDCADDDLRFVAHLLEAVVFNETPSAIVAAKPLPDTCAIPYSAAPYHIPTAAINAFQRHNITSDILSEVVYKSK